jgi:predicted transcriptional regulator
VIFWNDLGTGSFEVGPQERCLREARMYEKTLLLDSRSDAAPIRGLSSDIRLSILNCLGRDALNVNEIAEALVLPQSTVATNVLVLEEAGLLVTENVKARKGSQKLCRRPFQEVVILFDDAHGGGLADNAVEVGMPVGLYTNYEVSAPCGLSSTDGVVGFLDVPDSFLSPDRMKAGVLWFESGWVEYKFPNNSLLKGKVVTRLELVLEVSSETLGTNNRRLSDIAVTINNVEVGVWTSPGGRDERSAAGGRAGGALQVQSGLLKTWGVTNDGTYVDGVRVSDVVLDQLQLAEHHSVKVKIGIDEGAENRGGVALFGATFGNYHQDIVLRLVF